MPKLWLAAILLFISFNAKAQTWEIGFMGGGAGYIGDLNPTNPVKFSGASAGGYIKRNFNGYLSLKANAAVGRIGADDRESDNAQLYNRNLSFYSRLDEISLIGELNFFKYIPDVSKSRFTPYIYAGIGMVHFNPRTVYQGDMYYLRPLTTEGQSRQYNNKVLTIPYGAGVKYNIAGKITLGADIGYRRPNTDYLDDVSGLYADRTLLNNNVSRALADRSGERTGVYTGVAGTQRGDLRRYDQYFFMHLTVAFTFVTQRCYFEN